jgi:hypothetical protein
MRRHAVCLLVRVFVPFVFSWCACVVVPVVNRLRVAKKKMMKISLLQTRLCFYLNKISVGGDVNTK